MKRKTKNKGFTLLELMVAISIFAGLVILVVGSFAASTNYQRRVKVNREVSQAARNVLDSISREVAFSLNQPILKDIDTQIKYIGNGEPVYNFAVLRSRSNEFAFNSGNILVVRDETNHCRRYRLVNAKVVVEVSKREGCLGQWEGPYFLTNENVAVKELTFLGINNTKFSPVPYLEIKLTLNNSQEFFGDKLIISMSPETTVTIRNDGQEQL